MRPQQNPPSPSPAIAPQARGVRGWLLLLCLMLVVVGPVVSVALLSGRVQSLLSAAPPWPAWLAVLAWLSAGFSLWALVRGVRAGLALWRLQRGAVAAARSALLLGLAAELADTVVEVASAADGPGGFVFSALLHAMPGVLFFVLAFAYLQRSRRVQASFGGG